MGTLTFANRVKETSTTTGTGTLSLAGAVTGFRTFVAGHGTGNDAIFMVESEDLTEWELVRGTVTDATPDTLSRDTVILSSNANALVSFTKALTVYSVAPAEWLPLLHTKGDLAASTGSAATRLAVGTDGQVLKALASEATGLVWGPATPLTTKGDLLAYSTQDARLAVGSAGHYLTPDAAEATGLKWTALPAGAQEAVPYGELYWNENGTATSLGVDTWAKASGTSSAGDLLSFTHSTGRLTYTGTKTRKFMVSASLSEAAATGNGTICSATIAVDGTPDTSMQIDRKIQNASDEGAVAIGGIVSLATNSYVEVWLKTSDGDDITLTHLNLRIQGVPEWTTESPLSTKGDLYTYSTDNTRLAIGADNTVLTADSNEATGMKWAAAASGGTPWHWWLAEAGIAYSASPAAFGTRNGHGQLCFDDSTDESIIFQGIAHTDLGAGDLTLSIYWAAATAITGNVVWTAAFEEIDPDVLDIDADSFASAQTVTDAAPGTSGYVTKAQITFTIAQADNLSAGSPFRLLITRDANNGSDTMTGDACILRVALEQ